MSEIDPLSSYRLHILFELLDKYTTKTNEGTYRFVSNIEDNDFDKYLPLLRRMFVGVIKSIP